MFTDMSNTHMDRYTHMGHTKFKPGQREALEAQREPSGPSARATNLLVIMPTAGGKSTVYQLPVCMQRRWCVHVHSALALAAYQLLQEHLPIRVRSPMRRCSCARSATLVSKRGTRRSSSRLSRRSSRTRCVDECAHMPCVVSPLKARTNDELGMAWSAHCPCIMHTCVCT